GEDLVGVALDVDRGLPWRVLPACGEAAFVTDERGERGLAHLHVQALVDAGDGAGDGDRRRDAGAVGRRRQGEVVVVGADHLPRRVAAGPDAGQVDDRGRAPRRSLGAEADADVGAVRTLCLAGDGVDVGVAEEVGPELDCRLGRVEVPGVAGAGGAG